MKSITSYKYLRAGKKSTTCSYNALDNRYEAGVSVYPITWEVDAEGDTVCVIGDGSVHMTCMILGYKNLNWHLLDGEEVEGRTGGDNEPLLVPESVSYGPKYEGFYRIVPHNSVRCGNK